ncbi:D-lactate dehydrogenase (cytochrome) [Halopenitus malekzadehii]|uniref:D-lactate dehydrogenase (cytochrome) n=1 Tax=Halopenitus malekzadehii TaxID=1267564 RepID=A0A1H6HNF4_9EURY|nr:FAD-linked oxidase C-terminal domain-containing protein [Halopenitus malekzadehii]SEH37281.1 D-lactate dehydrogenase (cytochrome) [Halopenitus malekzadehii]
MQHDCSFLDDLAIEGEVSRGPSDKRTHASDFGTREAQAVEPDAVVFPESTADVSAVLSAANDRGVPVTPYAAGTGLEANATPVHGGISLDMTRMDAVLEVRPADLQIDVEPGVIGEAVNEAVAGNGLFFPPLPSSGSISTIGGMIATDASGQQTVKYGEVADWVLELEVVRADGTVVTVGSKAAKTSSGYNLCELFVGSEGTLGVVTRATLELAGRPEQVKGGRAVFETLADATEAISDVITSGVDVAKLELIDERTARMVNAYADVELPERPMTFLEFHANHGIDEEIAFCRTIVEAHDVAAFEIAGGEKMAELWRAREEIAYASEEFNPDREMEGSGDVTVPIGRYPEMIAAVQSVAEEYDRFIPCFGHAGDGNLHYGVFADPDDPEEVEQARAAHAAIVDRAIELGGTATGEHGIGRGKRKFLEREHGTAGVDAMRAVKETFDPNGILNPGKVLPDPTDQASTSATIGSTTGRTNSK